jgi:cysteine desulfurase / selenocysteine lyase
MEFMSHFDAAKIRADFPLLTQKIRGKNIIYLDSAATSLKPWPVIERISHFNTYETANVHRGAHYLADQATGFYESTRSTVAKFLGAQTTEEIIFTKGTTESINLVAQSYGRKNLQAGDEVLISEMEHHANIVPWQLICEEKKAKLVIFSVNDAGELDFSDFKKRLSSRTKILAVSHCSNILGTMNDLKPFIEAAHQTGAVVLVDGAQMVSIEKVDVKELDCDFYAFSGHKLFGPYGVGVLYGKKALLQDMPPYQGGGSMIDKVCFEQTTYNELPYKFEAGTPNIEAVIALKPAIEYVEKIGLGNIHAYKQGLLQEATEKLRQISGLRIIGQAARKTAIISFVIESLHHADIGQILDQENIAVRVGHHCTMPLLQKLGITGTVRASFSVFNNRQEIDALVKATMKAKEMLG